MDEFNIDKKLQTVSYLIKEDKKIIKQVRVLAFVSFLLAILILLAFLIGFVCIIVGFVCLYNAKMQVNPGMQALWIAGVCILCLLVLLFAVRIIIQLSIKKSVKDVIAKYCEKNKPNLLTRFLNFCIDDSKGMFLFFVFNPIFSFIIDWKLFIQCNKILHLKTSL